MFIDSEFKDQRKYQQIPYNFFTPRQLGSIYESLLEFKLEEANTDIVFHKGRWKEANLKSEKVKSLNLKDQYIIHKGQLFFTPDNKDRKMTGSYYTPDYIVQYIVENTLGPLVKTRTSQEILELKVCDPAMGSGHFLAGALDFLVNAYREKLSEELMDDIDENFAETSRKVLDACIFGVDINPRAVKLAKMSLWLQSAFAGRKLERLDDQLMFGDSLNSFQWKKEFKLDNGFDAVIGNPPYFKPSLNYKEKLKENYHEVYSGGADIYYYFMCLPHTILNDNGGAGFIVSRSFIEAKHAEKTRKFISSHFKIEELLDFSDNYIFKGVGILTSIITLRKSIHEDIRYKLSTEIVNDANNINDFDFFLHKISQKCLSFSSWDFKRKATIDVDYNCFINLENIANVYKSMETGKNHVFTVTEDKIRKYKIENSLLKPLLKSGSIKKFKRIRLDKRLLWTHHIEIQKYPNAYKYLSTFKECLSNRYDIKARNAPWYEPSNPRAAEAVKHSKVKIVVPYIASENMFYVDDEGCYNDGGDIRIIILKPQIQYSYYFLCGYLNSSFMEIYHKTIAKHKSKGMYEYFNNVLNKYPIPIIDWENKKQISIVHQIEKVSKLSHDSCREGNDITDLLVILNKLVDQLLSIVQKKEHITPNKVA